MVKKKDPLKADDPYNAVSQGRSDAGVGAPAPEQPKDYTPKIIRDENTGVKTGIVLPDGTSHFGISPKEVDFLARKYNKNASAPAGTQFMNEKPVSLKEEGASPELSAQIGTISPEQQAIAAQNPELPGKPNLMQVLRTAGERAAIGAAGGVVAGAAGGSIVPGLGTLAGAGIGAVGGGLVGGVSALFSEYKKTEKANYNTASQNYDLARQNLDAAISLANKGAGYEANALAVKNYNKALAQISFAEQQFKLLSKDQNSYIREIKDKLTEIEDFKQNDRARLDQAMDFALQKPTKTYVNQGAIQ
jgi:hypothetical protein